MSWGDPPATSPEVSARMRAVKVRDTKPELELRRLLHARGLRYRVDVPLPLEGVRRKSDLTFGPSRVIVFVDGCYWHGCPEHFKPSGRNVEWWRTKMARNRARDADTNARLRATGWWVIRVWEHADLAEAAEKIARVVEAGRVGRPVLTADLRAG